MSNSDLSKISSSNVNYVPISDAGSSNKPLKRFRSLSLTSDRALDRGNARERHNWGFGKALGLSDGSRRDPETENILDGEDGMGGVKVGELPAAIVEDQMEDDILDDGSAPASSSGRQGGQVSYGSTPPPPTSSVKRVIYCVHGNPSSRCCAVMDNNTPLPPASLPYGHCHKNRNEEVDKKARRKLIIASVLCVIFMIGEVIGGYLSSSLAIATDAAHLLTDFASFMISLFSLWVASRPATRRMSFGWYRAEVIGALTSVLMIWVVTGILVYLAIERIMYKDFEIDATVMLITSAVGVAVNILMGLTLHQHGHGHSHGGGSHGHSHGGNTHSHSDSSGISNSIAKVEDGLSSGEEGLEAKEEAAPAHKHQENNINVRAAYIHVIGDFLQSFGVFIAALVIYYKPEWSIVDPICTFLFSVLVIFTTLSIIRDTLTVLMEGSPRGVDFQQVCNTFLSLKGVVRVHNLRMWALSLDKTALAAHLAIKPGVEPQRILQEATRLVHEKYDFFEMTLQIEEFIEDMEDCNQCKMPAT